MRELKDPRISDMLTVVKVDVSGDLSYAKVYISAIDGIESAKKSVKGLESAQGYIRKQLGTRLHLRKSPELKFIADDSIEKGMKISVNECANTLKEKDNILILTHANPDGDTLGCGYALCRALMKIGKICSVINADNIPKKYNYLFDDIVEIKFKPDYIVAVDVATVNLLGGLEEQYKVDMCIDHHSTNTEYADLLLLEDVPAACQIMYDVVLALGIEVDKKIADCLYTGLTTDTGCFRYDSTTAQTYRVAADLIEAGADNGRINRIMFETKTKTYARLERLAIESMRFYEHERVAVITVTQEMFQLTGSNAQETEGLAPLTRQIEGVEIGITIQEKPDGTCKASIRTFESVNAAELAKCFGGGGHAQAAGCRFDCDVKEARRLLVDKCREILE